MKKQAKLIVGLGLLVLILAGWFVPLETYTTKSGCPIVDADWPKNRLHLIRGDSIEKIKKNDVAPPPNVGCSINETYVLYFL